MGLKQDIVIVNEYTVKSSSGKGSRGSSPGNYLTSYMARELATETLAPIRRQRTDDFIMRYMARESATEVAGSPLEMKRMMKGAQGRGGVAFGYGQMSLSDEELRAASKDIQQLYDEGHTVMKTVLSFDQEYLRKHGLIPEDFACTERGDYRGQLDQMKLRMAITHGLDRMSAKRYDDLRFSAVIQVDTEHVHCHLVMADAGQGNLAKDGTQKGKIDSTSMRHLRRGIDSWLDEKQQVAHLSSAVVYERLNVVSYVKRWAHEQMLRESTPQFLLACLPEDRSLWRAGTNRKEMAKPNRILGSMIEDAISRPGSPMSRAMEDIQGYADHRRKEEGLSAKEWGALVDTGRSQVVERSMNGVYGMLRALPANELEVRTPMLEVMSMDYEQIAQKAAESQDRSKDEDDLLGFGFRLRTYSSRMRHHRTERDRYHEQSRRWESLNDTGGASQASRALYDFYQEEEDYQARCAAKYQHFLPFTPSADEWYEEWDEIGQYGEKLIGLQMMSKDQTLRRMKNEERAEDHGQEVYGQAGGSLLTRGKEGLRIIEGRLDRMRETYKRKIEDLQVSLAGKGLTLHLKVAEPDSTGPVIEGSLVEPDEDEASIPGARPRRRSQQDAQTKDTAPDEPVEAAHIEADIIPGAEHSFDLVKALDLHHMRYDFNADVEVGLTSRGHFIEAARRRREALDGAVAYLEGTGQDDVLETLPLDDVTVMNEMADEMVDVDEPILHSHIAELARSREIVQRSRTVRLSAQIAAQVDSHMALSAREAVEGIVISGEYEAQVPEIGEPEGNDEPDPQIRGSWRTPDLSR